MNEDRDILNLARELAAAINCSAAYLDYQSVRERVSKRPELMENLREFKKTQIAYEIKRMRDNEPADFNQEKYIGHLRAELMLNPDTRDFLVSEGLMFDLHRQVAETLEGACDMELFD